MNYLLKILLINFILLLIVTAILKNDSTPGNHLGYPIGMALWNFVQFFVNLLISLSYFLSEDNANKENAKYFLMASFIILLIGFSFCTIK